MCPRAVPRELDHCVEAGSRGCYYTTQYTLMLQTRGQTALVRAQDGADKYDQQLSYSQVSTVEGTWKIANVDFSAFLWDPLLEAGLKFK